MERDNDQARFALIEQSVVNLQRRSDLRPRSPRNLEQATTTPSGRSPTRSTGPSHRIFGPSWRHWQTTQSGPTDLIFRVGLFVRQESTCRLGIQSLLNCETAWVLLGEDCPLFNALFTDGAVQHPLPVQSCGFPQQIIKGAGRSVGEWRGHSDIRCGIGSHPQRSDLSTRVGSSGEDGRRGGTCCQQSQHRDCPSHRRLGPRRWAGWSPS